ncbi:MAG TPA: class I SAM-dependent methyltransferase [Opitutaceae bacterium]|nr:class I SAM-dependent methyltransferase [Opitutaceae bacterium]
MISLTSAPTLKPLPTSPRSSQAPPPEPLLTSLPFYGRALSEYVSGFALDLTSLRRCAVLDVGSGASSFAVEASRREIEVAAVDPLYGCSVETLATHVQLDYARVSVDSCRRLKGEKLLEQEEIEQHRRAAAQRFLSDYESGFLHNRYLGGALPSLPFLDRSFDLVLCGHVLLGAYARFDDSQVITACRELLRVSAGVVRIGPFEKVPTTRRDALLARLQAEGIAPQIASCVDAHGRTVPQGLLILRRATR